jgi:hypothetical protein
VILRRLDDDTGKFAVVITAIVDLEDLELNQTTHMRGTNGAAVIAELKQEYPEVHWRDRISPAYPARCLQSFRNRSGGRSRGSTEVPHIELLATTL